MESGVAKHTSEDSQDSRVQFITPAGPRGIGSQQGPGRWLRRTQFYTPLLCITGYVSNVSQHAGTGELTVTTCRFRRYRYPNWDHLTFASSLCHLWGGGLIPIALLPVAPTGSQRDGHDWATEQQLNGWAVLCSLGAIFTSFVEFQLYTTLYEGVHNFHFGGDVLCPSYGLLLTGRKC